MKTNVKLKTIIPARKFACPDGPIKAEGKSAATPFCYRIKVTWNGTAPLKTMIELHSRITGRKIGYIGNREPVVPSKSKARVWVESTKEKQGDSPKAVEKKMQDFLKIAQKDLRQEPWTARNLHSMEAWAKIISEARKRKGKGK